MMVEHVSGDARTKFSLNQPLIGADLPWYPEVRTLRRNNTRQGYVREDILKLAGFLFLEWLP